MITLTSKLPLQGTTIFSVMSALAAEHGALNLSQGFPDEDGPPALLEALGAHALAGHNQYAPMAGLLRLREQIAAKLARCYAVEACPDAEITVLPGATAALHAALTTCVQAGDEVIVLDPCYDSYIPVIELCGGRAVRVPLLAPTFRPDWERIANAISARTRAIVINTPHNPCGAVLSADDLDALAALAERFDLLVISDEVYEHLVFDGAAHRSVLQHPVLRPRSFAVFSFGKTYQVTGWKTGYCVAPPALTTELRKIHQFVSFVGVTPVQHALADFMVAEPDYPARLTAAYQQKRDHFVAALAKHQLQVLPAQGTYFQLIDTTDWPGFDGLNDLALARKLTMEFGIASIPVSVFSAERPARRLLRFCFAKQPATLLAATQCIAEAVRSASREAG
jgi:methionine aminotransferase